MKLMSKRVGVLTAAAFAMSAGVSVVSAQFVSTLPAGSGGGYATQNCSCAGGGAGSRASCFACCTNERYDGGAFTVDPANTRTCFGFCSLQRLGAPCGQNYNPGSQLPQ